MNCLLGLLSLKDKVFVSGKDLLLDNINELDERIWNLDIDKFETTCNSTANPFDPSNSFTVKICLGEVG